jgi:hypothetical protein
MKQHPLHSLRPGYKLLQERLAEIGWTNAGHLHPAQTKRILVDKWVLVVDSRNHPYTQFWVCPVGDLDRLLG